VNILHENIFHQCDLTRNYFVLIITYRKKRIKNAEKKLNMKINFMHDVPSLLRM